MRFQSLYGLACASTLDLPHTKCRFSWVPCCISWRSPGWSCWAFWWFKRSLVLSPGETLWTRPMLVEVIFHEMLLQKMSRWRFIEDNDAMKVLEPFWHINRHDLVATTLDDLKPLQRSNLRMESFIQDTAVIATVCFPPIRTRFRWQVKNLLTYVLEQCAIAKSCWLPSCHGTNNRWRSSMVSLVHKLVDG